MSMIEMQVTGWMITAILGTVIGWLGNMVKHGITRDRAVEQGMRVLLRARLEAIYNECDAGRKPITAAKKHDADDAYDAYSRIGGNGWGSEMHEAILHAPTALYHGDGKDRI